MKNTKNTSGNTSANRKQKRKAEVNNKIFNIVSFVICYGAFLWVMWDAFFK